MGTFTASAANPQAVTVTFPAITNFAAVNHVLSLSVTSHEVNGVISPMSITSARGLRLARAGHLPSTASALTMSSPPPTPANRTTSPVGIGFARGSISTAGLVPLAGTLGDGHTFTASLNLGLTDQAVVWLTSPRPPPQNAA